MKRFLCSLLLLGGLTAGPAQAEAPPPSPAGDAKAPPSAATPGTAAADASEEGLRRGLELPFAARDLRGRGVPEADVRGSLGAMRDAKVPAGEAADVAVTAAAEVGQHGPVDNFGAFVQAQLASGLRGQELAAAIKAEHAANGKGKSTGHPAGGAAGSAGNEKPADAEHGHGKSDAADHGGGKPDAGDKAGGRPEGAGKPPAGEARPAGGTGKPGGAGKSDEKGGGK